MNAIPKEFGSSTPGFGLLINGRLVAGNQTLDVVNPATGKVFTTCPRADVAQLHEAVAAAKAAFPAWSRKSWAERKSLVLALADALEGRLDEFAELLTREQGKPLAHATDEVGGSVAMIRAFAAMDLPTKILRESDPSASCSTTRRSASWRRSRRGTSR